MPTDLDRESAWCADFERRLRQRGVRMRYRRARNAGYVYACERPGNRQAAIWVPPAVIRTGVYGVLAALAEVEEVLEGTGDVSAAHARPGPSARS